MSIICVQNFKWTDLDNLNYTTYKNIVANKMDDYLMVISYLHNDKLDLVHSNCVYSIVSFTKVFVIFNTAGSAVSPAPRELDPI